MVDNFDYLIVGGGMTAAAAVQGIREVDSKGTIGLFSLENQPPYSRPPLTKKLWYGKSEGTIWSDLPKEHLELILGSRVSRLEPSMKQLQDGTGHTYGYKKLLLATGGSPRHLPFAPSETVYYRSLEDYHTVRGWVGKDTRIGIIGGGFIGSEIAAALASNGEQVLMIFPENGIGARIYPGDLAQFVTQYYQKKGVEVHSGMEVQSIEPQKNGFILRAQAGQTLEVNHIIAGIGIIPNVELAQLSGIAIGTPEQGGGILVNKYLATNLPEIYAAGDVASFYNPFLKQWMRVEHEDNANSMGRIAGLNMAGKPTLYKHQPFFYSDLFDLGFEAVGEINSRLEIYADWKELFKEGVIYYLAQGKVKGVLLWNVWNTLDAARALIEEPGPFKASDLKNRLPMR